MLQEELKYCCGEWMCKGGWGEGFPLVPLCEDDINVVILCGCTRVCGNKEEVRARVKRSLVVAVESLCGRVVPEACLPSVVEQEIGKILQVELWLLRI